ncbi:MAG TPA: 2-hydroxyacid dehydrogenase [Methylotenera sp.]
MKIAFFSTKSYDEVFMSLANQDYGHELIYFESRLTADTAKLATGFPAVCVFVNDQLNATVLQILHENGTRLIALRSAGFNHVDLAAAERLNLTIVRVPAYSPYAVAEHALALILGLNRKLYRAYNRVREGNFSLEGLLGFDLHAKKVGVVGTGKIGMIFANIMNSIGCDVLLYDPCPNQVQSNKMHYVGLAELYAESDIISLHCPLTPETHHMINHQVLAQMKKGVMLINTSRGKLVDTKAVISALKSGKIGNLGLDVYEEEGDLFFDDLSNQVIHDDVFMRLLTFPNVLITGHQGFFTKEALTNIAQITLANITAYETDLGEMHRVTKNNMA